MKKEDFEIQLRKFANHELSSDETDALWKELMMNEDRYEQWVLEMELYQYFKQLKEEKDVTGVEDRAREHSIGDVEAEQVSSRESGGTARMTASETKREVRPVSTVPIRRIWPLAAATAAAVLLALALQMFQKNWMPTIDYLAVESISPDYMISAMVYRSGPDRSDQATSAAPESSDTSDSAKKADGAVFSNAFVNQQIDLAVLMAMRGDHNASKNILEEVLESIGTGNIVSESQQVIVQYNYGIALYNTGEYERALSTFSALQTNDKILQNGHLTSNQNHMLLWFRANANLKMNKRSEASAHLEELSLLEGIIPRQAAAILKKLKELEAPEKVEASE